MSIDWEKCSEDYNYFCTFHHRFCIKPCIGCKHCCVPRPKPQSSEWDEAGEFPPTGERVDACVYGEWQELVISGYGNKFCIGINDDGEDIVFEFSDDTFRPIRTKVEREREELESMIRYWLKSGDDEEGIADAILAKYELKERTNDN